jgi:hypothetical protein
VHSGVHDPAVAIEDLDAKPREALLESALDPNCDGGVVRRALVRVAPNAGPVIADVSSAPPYADWARGIQVPTPLILTNVHGPP